MILPFSQSKVKTDPLQAKAQAFAGLSILSPSLSNSFLRVPNPGRIAATTEQANPPGVYVSIKNNLIDCALRFLIGHCSSGKSVHSSYAKEEKLDAHLLTFFAVICFRFGICGIRSDKKRLDGDESFFPVNPFLNYLKSAERSSLVPPSWVWIGRGKSYLRWFVRWGRIRRHIKLISIKSGSVSCCVARDEVFYISLPCDCVPFDWQEFRQVSQTSF